MLKPKLVITIEAGEWTPEEVESFIEWLDDSLTNGNMATGDDALVTGWRVEEENTKEKQMTIKDLTFEYCQGKVFVCKPKMDKLEVELNHKMKGRIVSVAQPDENDVVLVTIDTSDFVDHNNFHAQSNYYAPDGIPSFTAREAGCWPKNEKHSVYFMADDLVEDYFDVNLQNG